MIIVSQNREQIINFNTLSFIGLSEENMKQIVAHDVNKHVFFVGIYKTEERAREVLEKIITVYRCSKTCEGSITEKLHAQIALELNKFGQATFVYQMPKE